MRKAKEQGAHLIVAWRSRRLCWVDGIPSSPRPWVVPLLAFLGVSFSGRELCFHILATGALGLLQLRSMGWNGNVGRMLFLWLKYARAIGIG